MHKTVCCKQNKSTNRIHSPITAPPTIICRDDITKQLENIHLPCNTMTIFLAGYPQKMRSIIYLQTAYTKANLLIKMNNKTEAAHLYEEISMITDSVVAPSYAHRINNLRASYQENRMKVENKAEFNRIFLGGILIGIIVLGRNDPSGHTYSKTKQKNSQIQNTHGAVTAKRGKRHADEKPFPL